MGITDGKASSSAKVKASAASKPAVIIETNGCSEGAVPHMVITSVEGVDEEITMGDSNGAETLQPTDVQQSEKSEEVQLTIQQPGPSRVSEPETEIEQPSAPTPAEQSNVQESPPHDKAKSAIQRPLIINGTDESKASDVLPEVVVEHREVARPVVQSAVQRPLIIDGTEEQRKEDTRTETGVKEVEVSKSPSQSASQRPLIVDSETAKKQSESAPAVPESIYEVIEPKDRFIEHPNASDIGETQSKLGEALEQHHEPVKTTSSAGAKDGEGFFSRSKAFWKHEGKPIFNFPKFPFSTKEGKIRKKDPAPEREEDKEDDRRQEYSLETAETVEDPSNLAGKYRKIDEDVVLSEYHGSATVSNSETPEASPIVKSCPPVKITSRSAIIHPTLAKGEESKPKGIKAEAENFEIDPQSSAKRSVPEKRESTPESLYDTCCLKLALLVRNKALEIASETAKVTAPKKPPKPTPSALAKARAAIASRRLKDYESRPHTFGDDIPIGFDGIRYADDDTESSTDYKDVENLAIILNPECYGIISKMKTDNKSDSFRASSTCSGKTSYFTADSVTLKDENSSDNTLETVSFGSCDSIVCRPSSSAVDKKGVQSESVDQGDKSCNVNVKEHSKAANVSPSKRKPVSSLFRSFITPKKKVPPPIPPKPVVLVKSRKTPVEELPTLPKSNASDITRCVNSLSLSPRPVLKSTSNSAGIRKRPLTIADVKETQFLQYRKSTFETSKKSSLGKGNASKATRNLPLEPKNFTKTLSFSLKPSAAAKPTSKPQPPPRPPPPIVSSQKIVMDTPTSVKEPVLPTSDISSPLRKAPTRPPAPSPESHTVKMISRVPSDVPSPPRKAPTRPPAPPSDSALASKSPARPKTTSPPPPRPPPPIPRSIVSPETKKHETVDSVDAAYIEQQNSLPKVPRTYRPRICRPCRLKDDLPDSEVPIDETVESEQLFTSETMVSSPSNVPTIAIDSVSDLELSLDVPEAIGEKEDIADVISETISEASTDLRQYENQRIDRNAKYVNVEEEGMSKCRLPRPPPRIRRLRSRTVEIVALTERVPETRRRSQSLPDSDIEKRVASSNISLPEKTDLKTLYTTVQKDPSKIKSGSASPKNDLGKRSPSLETVSMSRPLPAPPPPPRSKSRSAGRRSKSHERPSPSVDLKGSDCGISKSESMPDEINGGQIKPPERKRKYGKRQFFSLRSKKQENDSKYVPTFYSLRFPKDVEVPIKPERKLKHHQPPIIFDENANVADSPIAVKNDSQVHDPRRPRGQSLGSSQVSSETSGGKDNSTKLQRSVSETTKKKQHSSWYDEGDNEATNLPGSWEKLDLLPGDIINTVPRATPPRKKKSRQTSKFYVDVPDDCAAKSEAGESVSNVSSPIPPALLTPKEDKETSPLRLECSEKSVQTSLETLSAGIASRGEASDDTSDLLDLAQTLQDELKTIIKRHKADDKSDEESGSASEPFLGITHSKKHADLSAKQSRLPNSSTSSSSELWQMSSSEDSDEEVTNRQDVNLSELSRAKKQKKIFFAAQEIMSSEQNFVDAMKLLNVDFREFVNEMSKQRAVQVLPCEVLNQILNHLPQLQHLNENLLMELKDRIEHWDKVNKIADVVVKMGPFLKLYSWYIQDFESTVSLLEESKKKYPVFGQIVREFECSPRCKRLTLNHYMLKPVQRIPQYRLLLQEYLHHLPSDSEDYEDTVEALRIVSEVANHANESMRQGDNFQKLMSIQSSILGQKEIIKPGRMFIKEGELMKLSRKGMQPRWFVLLNDLLLYLTAVQQGLFRINHELTLAGMKVAIPIQQDYQNEFSIISVTRSFTLAAKSPEERQEWIVALTKAIEENASKRSTFTAVRLQQKSQESAEAVDDEGFVLGKKAPVWIPDARVTMCQLCTSEFTVTFRRHHCRACGKVICSICSSNRISLQYLGNRIARVCDECYTKLGQGSSACTESGETDSDNQQIALKSHLRTDHWHQKKAKRHLPSVLKEVCANDKGSTISGYVHKRISKSWKRNWFVVKDKVLYEYKASEDVAALRSIPLLGFEINTFAEPFEGIDSSLLFELSHSGQPPILFHAETPGSAERWIKELKDATVLE